MLKFWKESIECIKSMSPFSTQFQMDRVNKLLKKLNTKFLLKWFIPWSYLKVVSPKNSDIYPSARRLNYLIYIHKKYLF